MSGADYLNTITENASRLGMRLQESFSEHTRDIALTRSNSAYFDSPEEKGKNIRKQLDSSSDREKLDAMKRLIALISKGRNVSEYFAQVVKNVASQNLEIRKLVYIYVLRYAEQEPDLALLSINTFQKDLNDSNPFIRAMALRVLSGIRVPMIGNVVVLAIKKCAADFSPYVRKVAALAIPKCYQLDESHLPSLVEIITSMLRDTSPLSIGSVAVAFDSVCPTRLDLLHQCYRRICRVLVEVDEWGQVDLLNILLRYARTMLPRPVVKLDGEEVDKDIQLLLSSAEPLLQSRNPAVVLAVSRTFWYVGPPSTHGKMVAPLLRLLQTSKEVERVVLAYLLVITQSAASLFAQYYVRFFLFTEDARQVKRDKIKILVRLINFENYQAILRELIEYADDPDDQVVSDSINAIGKCADHIPESTQQCLTALISMIKSNYDVVVSSAVLVLKHLVQTQLSHTSTITVVGPSQSSLSIISHLARKIDDIRHPRARACVIWLVGQYSASEEPSPGPEGIAEWAPDVLRKTAKSFSQEDSLVKLQIINLAAKLLVLSPVDRTLGLLARYVFSLARYDLDYDVRDRGRMVTSLLVGVAPSALAEAIEDEPLERGGVVLRREQVKLVLFDGKAGIVNDEIEGDKNLILGSLSVITGKRALDDHVLPDWLEKGVESSLRDSPEDAPRASPIPTSISSHAQAGSKGIPTPVVAGSASPSGVSQNQPRWTNDLDKFYEDGSDQDEESEEGSGDGGSEDDQSGEGDEEEEEEESGEGSEDEDEDDNDSQDTDEQGERMQN